jgi:hypothetical protein
MGLPTRTSQAAARHSQQGPNAAAEQVAPRGSQKGLDAAAVQWALGPRNRPRQRGEAKQRRRREVRGESSEAAAQWAWGAVAQLIDNSLTGAPLSENMRMVKVHIALLALSE